MSVSELLTALNASINIPVIIFLLAVGYCIKHTPALEKVSNNLIPIIIFVLSVIICGVMNISDNIAASIMSGVINAAAAIGLHSTGKNIFEFFSKGSISDAEVSASDDGSPDEEKSE